MIRLSSSAIRAVDYNPWTGILEVQFTSGSRWYTHPGVPWSIYAGLVNASSPGGFYHRYIKGRYR